MNKIFIDLVESIEETTLCSQFCSGKRRNRRETYAYNTQKIHAYNKISLNIILSFFVCQCIILACSYPTHTTRVHNCYWYTIGVVFVDFFFLIESEWGERDGRERRKCWVEFLFEYVHKYKCYKQLFPSVGWHSIHDCVACLLQCWQNSIETWSFATCRHTPALVHCADLDRFDAGALSSDEPTCGRFLEANELDSFTFGTSGMFCMRLDNILSLAMTFLRYSTSLWSLWHLCWNSWHLVFRMTFSRFTSECSFSSSSK